MLNEDVRNVKQAILSNAAIRESGNYVGLPWHLVFPRLGKFLPVIPRDTHIALVAGPGVGKTHSWIGMILFSYYKIRKEFPEFNLKVKFLISLLEDSKTMFINRLFCMILYDKHKIRVDILTLNSMRKNPLSQEVKDKLDDVEAEINILLEACEINDSITNPHGIYKWARNISNQLGVHHNKSVVFSDENGQEEVKEIYSHYTSNDPDLQVILILDNLNNLKQEKFSGTMLSKHESMAKWTAEYCRLQMVKHWKWTCITIQQLALASESTQYDYKGNLVVDKIMPSIDDLGGNKEVSRDYYIVLALFAPNRYGIKEYMGYNIERLRDSFRSIMLIKSNISDVNVQIPLYFDGACSRFQELPLPNAMTETIYKAIEERRVFMDIKK